MSLFLVEATLNEPSEQAARTAIDLIATIAQTNGGELIESQVTAGHSQIFTIVEGDACRDLNLQSAAADINGSIDGPYEVRLVGAELEEIKAARPGAGYLVEWDIPAEITMEQYLTRKAEKTPLYDEVPEVSFLRTYVREDTAKCLCFYDADTSDQVVHAREVVQTRSPVSTNWHSSHE